MRKIISVLLALVLVLGVSAVSFAYVEENKDGNYSHTLRDTDTGYTAGCIDVDVYFEYDGKKAAILDFTDNSYVGPDYRLNGTVTQISDTQVEVSYLCVPLFGYGDSIRINCILTANTDGNLLTSY